ncbi:hypothetical protein F4801DRAFT_221803 [Xylaria longipes]|nr:hypothetical protein F4801DRAFT_221803 [Xylaria longipes]
MFKVILVVWCYLLYIYRYLPRLDALLPSVPCVWEFHPSISFPRLGHAFLCVSHSRGLISIRTPRLECRPRCASGFPDAVRRHSITAQKYTHHLIISSSLWPSLSSSVLVTDRLVPIHRSLRLPWRAYSALLLFSNVRTGAKSRTGQYHDEQKWTCQRKGPCRSRYQNTPYYVLPILTSTRDPKHVASLLPARKSRVRHILHKLHARTIVPHGKPQSYHNFFTRRRSRRAGSSAIQMSKIGYVSCTWACRRNCSLPGRGPSQADRLIVTDRRFLAMGSPDKLHYPDRHVMREITRAQRLSGIVASHNTTLQVVSTYGTSYSTPHSISMSSQVGVYDTLSPVSVEYSQQNPHSINLNMISRTVGNTAYRALSKLF